MVQNSLISFSGLHFSYPDKPEVIRGIDLEFAVGEKTALIGPNGSGKTTLFLLLCGILKPDSGQIYFKGNPVQADKFNPGISYLFQNPDDQLFSATVYDDIAFGPLNMKLSGKEVEKRSLYAVEKVQLSPSKHKSPHHLSGGEKRLAALATLLSMDPEVYLLDEPTSNLDAQNRRNIIELIKSMPENMIISSHDLEFLLEVCTRCILLDQGSVVVEGEIRKILSDHDLLSAHHMEKPHSLVPHTHGQGKPSHHFF